MAIESTSLLPIKQRVFSTKSQMIEAGLNR